MTKAFLVAMIILTFAAFGVVNYKITQDSISIEAEASKIYPAALNRTLPDRTAAEAGTGEPDKVALPDEVLVTTDTCLEMNYGEAKALALTGACAQEGGLLDTHYCNEGTKTWWIDMDTKKSGCHPACVVNVETKTSEVNWRCTGVLPDNTIPEPEAEADRSPAATGSSAPLPAPGAGETPVNGEEIPLPGTGNPTPTAN